MIGFNPIEESHIPLMHEWLAGGEAMRWYARGPQTMDEIRQTYLTDKPLGGTHCLIIQYGDRPIGYLQYYRACDYPDWCSVVMAQPGDYGLDLFIGRDELIGKGIGTEVVRAALERLVFTRGDAKRCLLGPSPENARAIRCYEKCGFCHLRTVTPPDGNREYVMAIERPSTPAGDVTSTAGCTGTR